MNRRALSCACIVLSTTVLLGAAFTPFSPQQTAGPAKSSPQAAKDFAPLVRLAGADSLVSEPWFARCDDGAAWSALWEKHNQGSQLATVNFDRCTAIGIFLGKKTNSKGVIVTSIEVKDNHCLVRFDEQTFQTAGGFSPCNPYGIVILPKTALPIVIEENVQNIKDAPVRWKERARLPSTTP